MMEIENLKYTLVNKIAVNDIWKPDTPIFTISVLGRIISQK
jgi:hypothetical protein